MREMRIGRVTLQIRSNSSDPLTETARLVDRFPITTDEQWASWKSQGHCGKPASAYSLYCDNHEHMHRNDDPTTPVIQAIDNRPGGRQRVVMCAHIKAPEPSNDKPQIPATHTPTMNATTNATMNARTEKEITMSTTNNTTTSINLDAITAQIAALNAALAALNAPATTTPANVTTTPANVTTTPANVTTTPATTPTAPAVMIHFDGGLIGTFTANAATATTGNTGWRGQCKATGIDGQKYQVSFQAWLVGGNPAKPPTKK